MSFADLKKARKTNLAALVDAAQSRPNFSQDEGFWKPTVDKAKNGYAEVRFLPQVEGDAYPWVQYFHYHFDGPTGMKYVEKSPTTIGLDDPVREHTGQLYADKTEASKKLAKKYKRKLAYVVNVLVVKDPAKPENDGKVFRYKVGAKIFKMITDAMNPEFEDEVPFNPFDFWEGATFKLKIREVEGWQNYDKSEFADQTELFGGDEVKLEALYKEIKPLHVLIAEDQFKSYDELLAKFRKVLNIQAKPGIVPAEAPARPERAAAEEASAEMSDEDLEAAAGAFDDDDDNDGDEPDAAADAADDEDEAAGGEDPLAFFQRMAAKD